MRSWTLLLLAACGTVGPPAGGSVDSETGIGTGPGGGTTGGGGTNTGPDGGPGTDPTGSTRYHPDGFAEAEVHGPATKLQTESDCRSCHGADLSGGTSGVACDSCHVSGWETQCTYCHGGALDTTGAPPRDIDDNDDPSTISFPPHTAHVSGRIATADCADCHAKPTDALTPGHLFDDATAGFAEVTLAGATYDSANGSCSNLYCHGNGQTNGTVSVTAGPRTCHDCHADATTPDLWADMGGRHELHLDRGYDCSDCHTDAVGSDGIDDPSLHVNGSADAAPERMTWDPVDQSCSGDCHGSESW